MKMSLTSLFLLGALAGQAQNTVLPASGKTMGQLDAFVEATKLAPDKVRPGQEKLKARMAAEAQPDINRSLITVATDFRRVLLDQHTREGYLSCIDRGLARLSVLAATREQRLEIATYFEELMDIVGLDSSDGKLTAFVQSGVTTAAER